MKKIVYILLLTLFFGSCEEYLETQPKNVLAVKTLNEIRPMMGAYLNSINSTEKISDIGFIYNIEMSIRFNLYSDDLDFLSYDNWNIRNILRLCAEWRSDDLNIMAWSTGYETIGFCNTIIDAINDLGDESDLHEKEIILAEAMVIRSLNIFKLLQYFSPYKNNELGIPLNLSSKDVLSYDSNRKTQAEIYAQIIENLNTALSLETEPTEWNVFYSEKIINALLAQIYHYKAESGAAESTDWANARTYAQKVMEGRTLASSSGEFADLMIPSAHGIHKNNPYCLLAIADENRYNNKTFSDFTGYFNRSRYMYDATADLYLSFDPSDIRFNNYFYGGGIIGKYTQMLPWPTYINHYYPLFRNAEMQLIIAESYARENNTAQAVLELNTFKESRIPGYTGYAGSDVLAEILLERRKEFCYEFDFRWLDLRREAKGFERTYQFHWSGQGVSTDPIQFAIEDNDFRFTLPIPIQSELDYNKIEQNPGW